MCNEDKTRELKRLREIAGLSQYELSKLAEIPRNRLSLLECGYIEFPEKEFRILEQALREAIDRKYKSVVTQPVPAQASV
jgi:transcriptional regulator with XRE-family HTH domain